MIRIDERIIENHRRNRRPLPQCDHDRSTFAKSLTVPRQPRTMPELRHLIGSRTTRRLLAWAFANALTATAGRGGAVLFKTRPMMDSVVKERWVVGMIE